MILSVLPTTHFTLYTVCARLIPKANHFKMVKILSGTDKKTDFFFFWFSLLFVRMLIICIAFFMFRFGFDSRKRKKKKLFYFCGSRCFLGHINSIKYNTGYYLKLHNKISVTALHCLRAHTT